MIKWHDGYFYPGRVLDQSIDGRWLVKFHDGDMRVLHENQLLALSVLPKGQNVFTLAEDGYADQGVVYSYLRDGDKVDYIIRQENKAFQRFTKGLIILSQDQVDILLSFQKEPTTSCVFEDRCATSKGGMLFEGLAFLLTCSSETNQTKNNRSGTSHLEISDSETSDEEEEDLLANLPAFDKNRLVEQIEKAGGTLVNSFEEAQVVQVEQVFLVADTYLETYKYIQSIAAGIPCISHVWVNNCCSMNSLLDYHSYLLPTGYSVVEKKLIEWHFQTSIFERYRVLLVFTNNKMSIKNWIVDTTGSKIRGGTVSN
ncbi:TP53-binding protein 1-like isoform X2 [Limulus polyphemus]|nr:TP53-binding protein 1-like isoform X2 [Limulus polyphemus]XP_022246313.1 TP53-binding protein 1-like isoform X2 [Limulus polyphemus]XP_022246314.1 TP53-binding protein 1-like isoform X2 [Limulus polyphemus]XP_022246315.1 TP53-binding protein 1-like isoform X2 [Limulus polyphemus]XP_022246316.1 TP53-binding protein 1-like isoform X2 [Limulus polyphemus]